MMVEGLEITRAKKDEIAELVDLRICLLKEIGNIEPGDDISQLKEKLQRPGYCYKDSGRNN